MGWPMAYEQTNELDEIIMALVHRSPDPLLHSQDMQDHS